MLLGTNLAALTAGGVVEVSDVDPSTPGSAKPVGKGSGWSLTMSEEFNDRMQLAHAESGHVRMRPDGPLWRAYYDDYFHTVLGESPRTHPQSVHVCELDNLEIRDGHLSLWGRRLPEVRKNSPWPTFRYTSGSAFSRHSQTFGYFEARMRCPGVGYWPAFWMLPATLAPGTQQPNEIDIMEGFHGLTTASARLHPIRTAETASADVDMGLLTDWHVYAVERTPTAIRWYYDGVQVAYETNAAYVPQVPMCLLLSLQINAPSNYGGTVFLDQPASVDFDYIRCWEAG